MKNIIANTTTTTTLNVNAISEFLRGTLTYVTKEGVVIEYNALLDQWADPEWEVRLDYIGEFKVLDIEPSSTGHFQVKIDLEKKIPDIPMYREMLVKDILPLLEGSSIQYSLPHGEKLYWNEKEEKYGTEYVSIFSESDIRCQRIEAIHCQDGIPVLTVNAGKENNL